MRFLIYEQKYLELLEQGRTLEALECLRKELTPLRQDFPHIQKLTGLMVTSPDELKQRAQWDGAKGTSRTQLLEKLRSTSRLTQRYQEEFLKSSPSLPQDIFRRAHYYLPDDSRRWSFKRWSSRNRTACSTTHRKIYCRSSRITRAACTFAVTDGHLFRDL